MISMALAAKMSAKTYQVEALWDDERNHAWQAYINCRIDHQATMAAQLQIQEPGAWTSNNAWYARGTVCLEFASA